MPPVAHSETTDTFATVNLGNIRSWTNLHIDIVAHSAGTVAAQYSLIVDGSVAKTASAAYVFSALVRHDTIPVI